MALEEKDVFLNRLDRDHQGLCCGLETIRDYVVV